MSAGAYAFVSFARLGLANRIAAADRDQNVKLRPSIEVQLELAARRLDGTQDPRPIRKTVALYGPGDIVGVEKRAFLRVEPRDWTTNFEPNYLAAIEFYDEDFPWRYTPAAPDASGQLRPWLALVVLADGEFSEQPTDPERPLPFIGVASARHAELFAPADDLWAWAHVHVNRSLSANEQEIIATDATAVAGRLQAVLAEDPDLAYSRIVCPRRLQPKTSYTAFLVPVFEVGRLAGLKLAQAAAPFATASSWAPYAGRLEPDSFPYYHRWYFRTGEIGDFESLVRLLEPKPVDPRVGTRDMDVQQPGHALPGITDAALHGVLALGGALKIPRDSLSEADRQKADQQDNWATPYPHPFQQRLASFVNLSDDYETKPPAQANAASIVEPISGDPDPLITPPLYGCWHGISSRLLVDRQGAALPNDRNWIHELNLDPRYRVSAGFGTKVIQKDQENLMTAAWAQVGDILEANQRVRRFQVSRRVAFAWHDTDLRPLAATSAGRALSITAPVHARIAAAPLSSREPGSEALTRANLSLKGLVARSVVPPVLLSPALRRAARPGGRLVRSLPFTEAVRPADLVERVNRREVVPAPRKMPPAGVVTDTAVIESIVPASVPSWLVEILRRMPWVLWLTLFLLILIALLLIGAGVNWAIVAVTAAVGAAAAIWLLRLTQSIRRADALDNVNQPPSQVDAAPGRPDFVLAVPGAPASTSGSGGSADSPEAARFRGALKDLRTVVQASGVSDTVGENGPTGPSLVLSDQAGAALAALEPAVTITRRAKDVIRLPERIARELDDDLTEARAYPVIDRPMYRPLAELSSEMLLPNINRLENNSLSLLETNQKFIEAYMVGLNHEFSRELLWREFPTDQRGSYFRQFWDVSGVLSDAGPENQDALREQLRDIPPLDRWLRDSRLGDHDARPAAGGARDKVVLALRGELLKRYPTAVVYAHRAEWARQGDGSIDRERERTLSALTAQEEDRPPRAKLRTPLYEAKVEPDIYFFGFDLTVAEARGGTGEHANDAAGWFFVLKERPGEPRFGFDEKSAAPLVVWNDLGWDRVGISGQFIKPTGGTPPVIPQTTPAGQGEKEPQRADDERVRWDAAAGAAELAYIMYQAPVLVAVHAAEMLPV